MDVTAILHQLGVALDACTGTDLVVRSPIDGSQLACLRCHTRAEVQASMAQAAEAFLVWRDVPAPGWQGVLWRTRLRGDLPAGLLRHPGAGADLYPGGHCRRRNVCADS